MHRSVNVVHGESAGASLKMALRLRGSDFLVDHDDLTCGPLVDVRSEEWETLRRAYWHAVEGEERPWSLAFDRTLMATARELEDRATIVLWLGNVASEQLLLVRTIEVIARATVPARVEVVQLVPEHLRSDAWSVGVLNDKQIRAHPEPKPLSTADVAELRRCWAAVTAPDPAPLLSFLDEDSADFPYLRPSLRTLLQRYPDHRTGLSRWDTELLAWAGKKGPRAAQILGHTMGYGFDEDMIGDVYLFARLKALARGPHPLVTLSGDPRHIRTCEATLTHTGRAALAGEVNAVDLNGIDDWVLGVHLDSARGATWFRDGENLVRREVRVPS